MTIVEHKVTRARVEASVRDAKFPGHDPARWALPRVALADQRAGGVWTLQAFDLDAAAALWLPAHAGEPCHGDTMQLGGAPDDDGTNAPQGMALGDATAWLRAHQDAYRAANASCWARITTARDTSWEPLVVAPFGVGDRTGPPGTPLVVIDGLHRALGWALGWALGQGRGAAVSEPTLLAFVAGAPIGMADTADARGID